MSQRSCTLITAALTSATFSDKDVEAEVRNTINTLETELDAAGFEAGSDLEEAEDNLENALNELDERREELEEVAATARDDASEENDEDADSE